MPKIAYWRTVRDYAAAIVGDIALSVGMPDSGCSRRLALFTKLTDVKLD